MKEFSIAAENKPGQLAYICELMGKGVINIKSISTERMPNYTSIKIITEDEASARGVLEKNNLNFIESEVVPIKLAHQPGEMAKLARKIADSGINIESLYQVGSHISGQENTYQEYAIAVHENSLNDLKKLILTS